MKAHSATKLRIEGKQQTLRPVKSLAEELAPLIAQIAIR